MPTSPSSPTRHSSVAAEPILTVGILTRNSSRTLSETLLSLAGQTLDPIHWNITFIDHNSQDGTRQLLQTFVEERNNARLLTRAENNLSRSRQFVVDSCISKWIVFIDSDVTLPATWLADALRLAELEHARDARFSGVGAPLRLKPKSAALGDLPIMQLHPLGHFGTEQMEMSARPKRVTHLPTAAAFMSRADILACGGFDPACGDCGEDLELGERMANREGRVFWICPELVVEHLLSCETKAQWLTRAVRFGRARVKIARLHPRLWKRSRLWLPILFTGAQVGLAAAWASGLSYAWLVWLGICLLDLGLLMIGFQRWTGWRQAWRVSLLTFATHQAYAWGEFREAVVAPLLAPFAAFARRFLFTENTVAVPLEAETLRQEERG